VTVTVVVVNVTGNVDELVVDEVVVDVVEELEVVDEATYVELVVVSEGTVDDEVRVSKVDDMDVKDVSNVEKEDVPEVEKDAVNDSEVPVDDVSSAVDITDVAVTSVVETGGGDSVEVIEGTLSVDG
jgi:hypothetical protein